MRMDRKSPDILDKLVDFIKNPKNETVIAEALVDFNINPEDIEIRRN